MTSFQLKVTSPQHCIQNLRFDEEIMDCEFLVGPHEGSRRSYKAHKFVLAMWSSVFKAMFYGSVPQETSKPIIVDDTEPEIFEKLIDYVYGHRLNFETMEEAINLVYLAEKYLLNHLVQCCGEHIAESIDVQNVCATLEFAKKYNDTLLATQCKEFISINTKEVLASDEFLKAEYDTLLTILDLDKLRIHSEQELFVAVEKYAEHNGLLEENIESTVASTLKPIEVSSITKLWKDPKALTTKETGCNDLSERHVDVMKESKLTQVISKIRFLTMTPEEFAEGPGRSKLLPYYEISQILIYLLSKEKPMMPENISKSTAKRRRIICGCDRKWEQVDLHCPYCDKLTYLS